MYFGLIGYYKYSTRKDTHFFLLIHHHIKNKYKTYHIIAYYSVEIGLSETTKATMESSPVATFSMAVFVRCLN